MGEPIVSDKFNVAWRNAGEPFCDTCGLPTRRGPLGFTAHVSDAYPKGVPVEKDESDHRATMRKWWESI
jgi:hypothetical protein